jgi:hypothetical protein
MKKQQVTLIFLLTVFLSTGFSQGECTKCDIDKLKTVEENMKNLNYQIIEDFLCTFDVSCKTNIEYSEWSNELIFKVLENYSALLIKVLEQSQKIDRILILKEIENPLLEYNFKQTYYSVSKFNSDSKMKDTILKALECAAEKE